MALHDPVWREDVIDQEEIARDSSIALGEWLARLAYQGAPAELLQRLTEVKSMYSQAYAILRDVKQCFPSPHSKTYG